MIQPLILTTATLSASLLFGCGGGGSTNADGSSSDAFDAPPALLVASTPALALATSGTARFLKVTNAGIVTAELLELRVTGLPSGSTAHSSCPVELPPDTSCLVLIRPGSRPSAEPANLSPVPAKLTLRGSNTNVLEVNVSVITYGSFHQGGFVFALDDKTAITGGVSGKVIATADTSPAANWSPTATEVAGVSDNSLGGANSCNGAVDGRCNTSRILAQFASGGRDFAAAQCTDSREGGFADWYLPALCEMGYSTESTGNGICGTQDAPLVPDNIRSRLLNTLLAIPFADHYWTSTQSSLNPATSAQRAIYSLNVPTMEASKLTELLPSKCARAFAP